MVEDNISTTQGALLKYICHGRIKAWWNLFLRKRIRVPSGAEKIHAADMAFRLDEAG